MALVVFIADVSSASSANNPGILSEVKLADETSRVKLPSLC